MPASKNRYNYQRTTHFTYIWVIENASTLLLSSKIHSPAFVVQTIGKSKWHLEIKYDNEKKNFKLFICKERDDLLESLKIEFKITHISKKCFSEQSSTGKLKQFSSHRYGFTFGKEHLAESFPDGTLNINCKMASKESDVLQPGFGLARTRMGVECHYFVWEIKEFSSLLPGQDRTFFLHPTSETLPSLIFTFSLQEKGGKKYGRIAAVGGPFMGTCRISLGVYHLDSDGFKALLCRNRLLKVGDAGNSFEMPKLTSNRADFLPNDVLSLECQVHMSPGLLWSRIESYRQVKSSDMEASEMSTINFDGIENACSPSKQILRSLYEDKTLSDIRLRAGSQSFSAHKNILSARSPVFKAMFTTGMKESTAKFVDIPDLNASTLNSLLLYIYTNRVQDLQWEAARDLFKAADKYELLDLRKRCSDLLKANFSASNVCGILVLAYFHNDEDLKKAAQNFISQDSDILYSDAWNKLKKEHINLAVEATEQIIFNLRNSTH